MPLERFARLGRRFLQPFAQSPVEGLDAFGQHLLKFRLACNGLGEAPGDFALRGGERVQSRGH